MRSLLSNGHRLGFAALLSLLAGAALATTIHGPVDIAALTKSADVVVRAKVISSESRFAAGGEKSGQIFTAIELAPSEQWKGAPTAARIAIRMPGGEVGNLSQEVVGTGKFAPGEEVVVFLRLRAPATREHLAVYELSHWALGKFSIANASGAAPDANLSATRDRSGVECIGCAPSEKDALSLDELRQQVLAATHPVPP